MPLCEKLAAAGILLSPGDCFGHPKHFRLGFGSTEPEAFVQALAAIEEVIVAAPSAHTTVRWEPLDPTAPGGARHPAGAE